MGATSLATVKVELRPSSWSRALVRAEESSSLRTSPSESKVDAALWTTGAALPRAVANCWAAAVSTVPSLLTMEDSEVEARLFVTGTSALAVRSSRVDAAVRALARSLP